MRVFLPLSQGLQEYSKLVLLLEKHGNALGLMTFGVVFGYFPIMIFAIPDIIQPMGLLDLILTTGLASVPIIFLAISANFANTVVFDKINLQWTLEQKPFLFQANSIFEKWLIEQKNFLNIPKPQLSVLLYQLGQGGIVMRVFGIIKFNSSFLGAVRIFFKS